MQSHELPGGRGVCSCHWWSSTGGFYFSILGGFCAFFVSFLVSLLAVLEPPNRPCIVVRPLTQTKRRTKAFKVEALKCRSVVSLVETMTQQRCPFVRKLVRRVTA